MSVKQEHHFIGITSILVLSLGFAAWLSLTNPLNSEGTSSQAASTMTSSDSKTGVTSEAVPTSGGSRFPASLPVVKPRTLVEIFCNRKGQRIETSEAQVRLKLVGCLGSQKSQLKSQLLVKNLTNGFTASVFKDKETLSTDYIDVVKGENKLRIDVIESKTSITETDFTVISQKN